MLKRILSWKINFGMVLFFVLMVIFLLTVDWLGHHFFVISQHQTRDAIKNIAVVTPMLEQGELSATISKDHYWEDKDSWNSLVMGHLRNDGYWHIWISFQIAYFDPTNSDSSQPTVEIDANFDSIEEDLYYYYLP